MNRHPPHCAAAPGVRWILLAFGLLGAAGASAQSVEAAQAGDETVREAFDAGLPPPAAETDAAEPPQRPQVPFADDLPEVTTYGVRPQFGLPDSVLREIWEGQRREMEAMMLERERMSNALARDGFEAIIGERVSLLPGYDPTRERQIDYGVNDSTPTGVINLFGVGVGKKK